MTLDSVSTKFRFAWDLPTTPCCAF